MTDGALLSAVVVARDGFAPIARTVAALRAQTIADRIELLVVAGPGAMADAGPEDLAGFARVEVIDVPPIADVDRASAAGLLRAGTPVVANLEDHVFPEPEWAEEVLRGHAEGWAAMGGGMVNANPRTLLSWANVLISHMDEIVPVAGEATRLSSHNAIYATAAVQAYGERLPDLLGRAGGLMRELRSSGRRLGVHPPARFAHLQISRAAPLWRYRAQTGRNFAAARARHEGWSTRRRLLHVLAAPAVPALQTARIAGRVRALRLSPRVLPVVFALLVMTAWGEALGYARGAGRSLEELAELEVRRDRFMCRSDVRDLERRGGAVT